MGDRIIVPTHDAFCCKEVGSDKRVYIKKETKNNELVWAIYSPDGECMAQTGSREMAMALVRQNDLTAAQVH
ncbi:MAG: DUF1150 family protein [Alphaproteobacteria bacterium]|nr:DUF1150 family protein [Alphaproteobacteria bacterium]